MGDTHTGVRLDSVAQAVAEIAAGRPVVVVDDEDRENEGDLIFAASAATADLVGFTVRHTSGVICVSLPGDDLDRLLLPPMTSVNEDQKQTAFAVSVDAREQITTGISAKDRARTLRLLADSSTSSEDFTRPGHVFPLRAKPGGVLERPGHTEAAVDLATMAGLPSVGALCEIVHDDGSMMRAPALREFADTHGLAMISIADMMTYRQNEPQPTSVREAVSPIERAATTQLPTTHGVFTAHAYRNLLDNKEHMALVMGDVSNDVDPGPVLTRLHSECLTGDVLRSRRCDCGEQLRLSLEMIAEAGRGVVVYLRGHEGRGIGLLHKLQAYQLQDRGHDTVEANVALGLPADARTYSTGAHILTDLGVRNVTMVTNNHAKVAAMDAYGITVSKQISLPASVSAENIHYLTTKRDKLGHVIDGLVS